MKTYLVVFLLLSLLGGVYFISAQQDKNGQALYTQHCGSCHQIPDLNNIPASIWKATVLPEMAAKMGLQVNGYNPLADF